MVTNYVEFNAVKFLKDIDYLKDERERLIIDRDSISEIPGTDINHIRTGNISHPVLNAVVKRDEIQKKITEIDAHLEAFQVAYNLLSDRERELLDGFFFGSCNIDYFVFRYGRKYGLSRSGVYREREKVLQKFTAYFENEIAVK